MANVGGLALKVTADSGGLKADLDKAAARVEAFEKGLTALKGGALGTIGGAMVNSLGGGAGGAGIGVATAGVSGLLAMVPGVGPALSVAFGAGAEAAHGFAEKLDEARHHILDVRSASKELGTSVEEMGSILAAAGGDADAIKDAMFHYNLRLGEAQAGSKEAQEAFGALGLKWEELSRVGTAEGFMKVRDALSQVESQTKRTAEAHDIFGRGAKTAMEFLSKSHDEVAKKMERAQALHLVPTTAEVNQVKEAEKREKEAGMPWKGLAEKLATDTAGATASISEVWSKYGEGVLGTYLTVKGVLKGDLSEARALAKHQSGVGAEVAAKAKEEAEQATKIADAAARKAAAEKEAMEFLDKSTAAMTRYLEQMERADALVKEHRSPFEKWQDDIQRVIESTKDLGDKANLIAGRMTDEFLKSADKMKDAFTPVALTTGAETGSAEALRTKYYTNQLGQSGRPGAGDVAGILSKLLDQQQKKDRDDAERGRQSLGFLRTIAGQSGTASISP